MCINSLKLVSYLHVHVHNFISTSNRIKFLLKVHTHKKKVCIETLDNILKY